MKLKNLFLSLFASAILINLAACDNDDAPIEGLTVSNFPVLDGAYSTRNMRTIIVDELLGINYSWSDFTAHFSNSYAAENWYIDHEQGTASIPQKSSGTQGAFKSLIDGNADLILTTRRSSEEEADYARQKGISLIETPVAKDAFIFLVNEGNPVPSLTAQQIQGIYTGEFRDWSEIGGTNQQIVPYYIGEAHYPDVCERMESLVMDGQTMLDPSELAINKMHYGTRLYCWSVRDNAAGIIYGFLGDYNLLLDNAKQGTKILNVDGIEPNRENIENGTYPFVMEIYAVIRANEAPDSMTRKVYDKLVNDGKAIIEASRYIPY